MVRLSDQTGRHSLERLGRALARRHELEPRPPRLAGRLGRRRLRVLESVHEKLLERALTGSSAEILPAPAEWLLDNQHLILEALEQVREDLPARFYGELPRLAGRGSRDEPRVFVLARVAVQEGGGAVDPSRARLLLEGYQTVAPLTMGELWAFPAMLRVAVLEDLAVSGASLVGYPFRERTELHPPLREFREIPPEDRIPAGIGSLRTIDAEEWLDFFEETSLVERALRQRDPSGVYARMDPETRDRYRKAVERLSRRSERREEEVARAACRVAAEADGDAREGHVGHHLIGPGKGDFEARIGARPPFLTRVARGLSRASIPLYLISLGALTAVVLAGILYPAVRTGGSPGALLGAGLVALVPAITVAVAVVNRVVTGLLPPGVLPKMEYGASIPPERGAVVAVPALLTRRGDARALARQLELNYLGNVDPSLRFVLLTDFADAEEARLPEDRALLEEAREEVRRLNAIHGAPGHEPFLLLHRPRTWNPRQGCWMGRERKRGKLSELNRLVLGEGPTELSAEVGEDSDLRGARYVLTLDADTFLPQGAAARLIGTLDHPLNRPELDETGRLVSGYTVLQPRIETFSPRGPATWFGRVYGADAGLDLYSRAVSDVYQDLFGTGIFAGKGVYHVEAFSGTLRARVPDDALL
ncbi:MAG: cellobiose phosphorylase, partial [Gemmatimonadetes bacterium]|nr:cellobiose phosphorylase [Gemmatimonadota bacterium]NIR77146.1 cellobiose phosphorylase [Gemmatimonadota bacterium]NIT85661.1 cellobiose phosphorylase [Gemmatimonadota bacterium]NIU29493.1 cellobiose phosphorylase [Gemmatimonadota bacterium]NIU34547.1 cellobiose phosphorylase [Gemmatimonadota bacterium]